MKQANVYTTPSITAYSILHALTICAKSRGYHHLVSAELASLTQYFLDALSQKVALNPPTFLVRFFSYSLQAKFLECLGVKGFPEHCAMRKLLIEQQVRRAIQQGARQVLILGAGYDVLAIRLCREFPQVRFFELDRGPTRINKLQLIDDLINYRNIPHVYKLCRQDNVLENLAIQLASLPNNLFFINSDLSIPDWPQTILNSQHYNPQAKSIVVMEGLTMYLSLNENKQVLNTLHDQLLSKDSEIILSFKEHEMPVTNNRLVQAMVNRSGEKFKCNLTSQQVSELASESKYVVIGKAMSADLQRMSHHHPSEVKKDPSITENYYLLSHAGAECLPATPIESIESITIEIPTPIKDNKSMSCLIL